MLVMVIWGDRKDVCLMFYKKLSKILDYAKKKDY